MIALERTGQGIDDVLEFPLTELTFVTTITISELLVGLHRTPSGRIREIRRAFIETVVEQMTVLSFDLPSARVHAEISAYLMTLGLSIGINDTLIGAIALANDHSILTTNPKHFARIPGLIVEQPLWSR